MINKNSSVIYLKDTTFVIPIRIDSFERFENINILVRYLTDFFDTNILILEADYTNTGLVEDAVKGILEYSFTKDDNPVFHRTKYLNHLSRIVNTEYIAVWDSDVIVHPNQIDLAISRLRQNTHDFVFPYDGHFFDTGAVNRIEFLKSGNLDYLLSNTATMSLPYTSTACGGGFFARLSDYLECGGENENFYGWGQEDGERVKRWQILGKRLIRVKGPMFHLYHPRGKNSGYLSDAHRNAQVAEFHRVSSLNKDALLREIQTWKR